MASDLAIWMGVVVAGIGAVTGGYVFVTNLVTDAKKDADAKVLAATGQLTGRISEAFSVVETVRRESEERTGDLRDEVTQLLTQDRQDWRRDMDRLERAIEGFGNVAASVAAMGRSVEHFASQLQDHRQTSERQMNAVQQSLQRVGEGLAELRSTRPKA